MNILITGANGFIGRALSSRLAHDNKIVGVYHRKRPVSSASIVWGQAGLTDLNSVAAICRKHSPDVVIHCAGIAHQKIGAVDSATYMQVNSEATENLAKVAAKSNPDVCFIFFSSVSVYGEGPQSITTPFKYVNSSNPPIPPLPKGGEGGFNNGVGEDGECWPSSDYAVSKLDAERRLRALYGEGKLHNLVILRLAPVYDREWSLNLDRRIFAPEKLSYLRFGSGSQRMSALARPNLVEFIAYILQAIDERGLDSRFRGNDSRGCGNDKKRTPRIFNVCDTNAYEFNTIIRVFKKSGIQPNRPVISVPLSVVWVATRIAGIIFHNKKNWLHSCYDKLASDLVFNNKKMMETGFKPVHSIETIFSSTVKKED